MAKGKRKKSGSGTAVAYDSNDDQPDRDSDSYYHDEVDKFHMDRDQVLLDSGARLKDNTISSGEDEVLAFDDDDSDEDEEYEEMKKRLHQIRTHGVHEQMASDLEDDEERTKGKSDKAWGASKKKFYGGHDSDIDEDISGSEPEAAALEEQEAMAIQKRLMQALDEDDVGFEMFKKPTEPSDKQDTEKITQDLSKLSKREKIQLLKKQSPELLGLISDYKTRTEELQTRLLPVLKLIRNKQLPANSSGAKLIETKTNLYLNYLVNVSFYLMLKAKQTAVQNHPVIRRLLQYRNLMKQLDETEPQIKSEVDDLLEKINTGHEFNVIEDTDAPVTNFKSVVASRKRQKHVAAGKKKRLSELIQDSDAEEDDDIEETRLDIPGRKRSKIAESDGMEHDDHGEEPLDDNEDDAAGGDDEDEESQRRGINYKIAKNKGLSTKKRKELRNPRVKHKLKYRRAKIRRKGQVREVRKEIDRYGGEISGIRAGIKRSIKLK